LALEAVQLLLQVPDAAQTLTAEPEDDESRDRECTRAQCAGGHRQPFLASDRRRRGHRPPAQALPDDARAAGPGGFVNGGPRTPRRRARPPPCPAPPRSAGAG